MASAKDLDEAVERLRSLPERIASIQGDLGELLTTIDEIGSVKKLVSSGAKLVETKVREAKELDGECQTHRSKATEQRRKVKEAEEKATKIVQEAHGQAEALVEAAKREAKRIGTEAKVEAANIVRATEEEAERRKAEVADEIKALNAKKAQAEQGAAAAEKLLNGLTRQIEEIRAKVA